MSFDPITRWTLRCDGDTTRGQCSVRLEYDTATDDLIDTRTHASGSARVCGAGRVRPVVLDRTELDVIERSDLHRVGWHVARDGRLLCPAHVAALEYLARAALDGLPFDDPDGGS